MRPYLFEHRLKLYASIYSDTRMDNRCGNEVLPNTFKMHNVKSKSMKVELFTWGKLDYVSKVKSAFKIK